MNHIFEANKQVALKLVEKINESQNISTEDRKTCLALIKTLVDEGEHFPLDKVGRWIGFIQGVLYSCYSLDIDKERQETRPIFQEAYKKAGYDNIKSYDVRS